MIIKKLQEIINSERDVNWGLGQSRRLLIAGDGLPFSMSDTTMEAGKEMWLQYNNHDEACYCIEGEGEVEYNGKITKLSKGTLYAVKKGEKHCLKAKTDLRLVCIFSPPLEGDETHKENLNNDKSSY